MKCVELINESSLLRWSFEGTSGSSQSLPRSPIGVLEAACLSYRSDGTTVGSCANSSHNAKRRKLNIPFEVEL